MTQYNAGNAYLQIMPSFRGIEKLMQREVGKLSREIDKSIAQGTNDGILKAFRSIDTDKVTKSASEAGDKWSSAFERQLGKHLKDAADRLPEFEPKAKLNRFDRAIAQTKKQLTELAGTKIGPDGDTGLDQVGAQLDRIVARMTRLADETKNFDQRSRLLSTAGQADMVKGMVDDARAQGLTDGRSYGGAFAAGAKARIEQALKSLPEINLDADPGPAERAVAALRAQLVALGEKKIGVDIDRDRFMQDLSYITAQLQSLARDPHSVSLRYDLEEAAKGLQRFGESVAPTLAPDLEKAGAEGGEVYAGAYVEKVRRGLADAIRQIPNIPMTVDNSDAERKLAAIRVSMQELSDKKIGVDVDAGEAEAQVVALLARLRELDSKDVDIDVRTNAAAAAAQLELVRGNTDKASDSVSNLGRDAGITMSRLGYMIAIGASIGSVIAPAAATAALAVAGIGTAAAGALAGVGVLALGLVGIGDAVKKMDAYQKDLNKSSRSLSQANSRVASAQDQVANAERGLANTRQSNADAEQSSRERVVDAERNVGKARKESAKAIRDATRTDVDAQHDLTRAQADQRKARLDLNAALRDGVRALRELDTEAKQNSNEIDKATTESMRARLELDKILSNPRSSEIEKRQARETYQARLIQIEDLKNKQASLQEQQAKAAKQGVNSLSSVAQARDKVAAADERVRTAAVRAKDAGERVDEARVSGAERVADAQRAVVAAQRAGTAEQRQAQQSLASGQASLISAQRALQQAYEGTGTAGGDALDNMRDAMNELSPAGQEFAKFLYSLKPALKSLRDAAQEGLLPGMQEGIQKLVDRYLPAFRDFVGDIAQGMGRMFEATVRVLDAPQWQEFFGFIADTALPSLQGMWVAALNLGRGVANLVVALEPLAAPMGQGLVDLTEKFALWSDSLKTSSGFQEFLDYAKREGPQVVHLIEQMVIFAGRLLVAMAPLGAIVVDITTAVFEWMNSWDIGTLSAVVGVLAVLGTTVWALTGFVRTIKFLTETWTAATLIAARAQTIMAAAVARYNAATVSATTSTGLLNGAMFRTAGAGATGAAGMAAMSAAAGPLAVALVGLAAVWYLQTRASRAAEDEFASLGGGLQQLGLAYEKAGNSATLGGSAVTDGFKSIAANDPGLQQAVVTLTGLGASLDDIAGAASGSAEQLDKVVGLIDKRIAQLSQERNKNLFDLFGNEKRNDEQERLFELRDRFQENAEAAHLTNQAMSILNTTTQGVTASSAALSPVQQALADAQMKIADASATAQEKMDALSKAQDAVRQANIDGIDAEEGYQASLDNLTSSVKQSKDAHEVGATSLSIYSDRGRANRDMIENLIMSTDKMYDADVALNGVTEAAISKGRDHYAQIVKVAEKLGLSKKKTDELVAAYGKIPPDVETAIAFKKGDFEKMFAQLEQAAFIQKALRENKDLKTAMHEYKTMLSDRNRASALGWGDGYGIPGHATGGPIVGPGTGTSDDVLMWGSDGEFMHQESSVNYYGVDFMHAINDRRIPKDALPGFAGGGQIGKNQKWNFPLDLSKTFIPSAEDLQNAVYGSSPGGMFDGALGGAKGGRGWQWEVSVVHNMFPDLDVYSTVRPGARTLSGNRSKHADGLAVDFEPRREVAEWIASTYGKDTDELITPWRDLMLWNGKPHKYSRAIEAQHGVFGQNKHIHWAYDSGGMLPPGLSTVYNGTGRPEPVLTGSQWDAVINGGPSDNSSGDTYHIEFAENKLTLAGLDAHQQRRATLARQGRPR